MTTKKYVDVDRSLEQLANDVKPANVAAIRDFVNHQAAEGISEVQQDRQITTFKMMLTKFAPEDFELRGATEDELKTILAKVHRSDYAASTKHKIRGTLKKFYKVENGGDHPDKVDFFTVTKSETTTVSREDLWTDDELTQFFQAAKSTRDRALFKILYESGARPGEILQLNIGDFSSNGKGDFIHIQGLKNTPDRTNQLVRAGRTVREWLTTHPRGGPIGNIEDPSAPMWVKTEQQACKHCGDIPHSHDDTQCTYEANITDRLEYGAFYRRFQQTCDRADIPENKQRPYNLRHTRLTEVATFMGYEQLNKFAGWTPGSDRAKVYVHLTNDDVNSAIRDEYGLTTNEDDNEQTECPFCGSQNKSQYSECRTCGRPLSLEQQTEQADKMEVLERLSELEEQGVLEQLLNRS